MDGIHDLGGMQGFGPVPVKTGDAHFRDINDWEKRMWGLSRHTLAPGITIDWFRHGIERMVPADYLGFAYFNKWCTNYLMLMLDNGTITMADVKRGHVENPDPPAAVKTLDDTLEINSKADVSFETEALTEPAFAVGQTRADASAHAEQPHPSAALCPRHARDHHRPSRLPLPARRGREGQPRGRTISTRSPSRPPNFGGRKRTRATRSRWTSGKRYLVPA